MIALLKTEKESVEFSDKIHQFLSKNRKGYNAERWSNINKSDNEDKWAVGMPDDIEIDLTGIELVKTLPESWRNTEEL